MTDEPETTQEETAEDVDFNSVQFQDCTRCGVGVLYVTRWDPEALHEQGENEPAPELASGGAYEVRCFNCDFRESRAFKDESTRGEGA